MGQWLGNVTQIQRQGNSFYLKPSRPGSIRIDVLSEDIVRVRAAYDGRFRPAALNRYGFVRENWPQVEVEAEGLNTDVETSIASRPDAPYAPLRISTDRIHIEVSRAPFQLRFIDGEGRTLLEESNDPGIQYADEGFRAQFDMCRDEKFYGFGDETRERLEHRGTKPKMWIENVKRYIPIPFFMSSRGYGIFVNTTWRHGYDMGATSPDWFSFQANGGQLDFYFIYGPTLPEILHRYTLITGRPTLPPKWSFGLWFICRTQANDHEVITDAHNFRREGIPCDVIGLEPGWMEVNYDASVNRKWHHERFPFPSYAMCGPHTFTAALKRMGFKIELWECNDYDLSIEAERRCQVRGILSEGEGAPVEGTAGVSEDIGGASGDTVGLLGESRSGIASIAAGEVVAGEMPPEEQPRFLEEDVEKDEHFTALMKMDKLTRPDEPWFEHHKKFIDQGVDFFKQDGAYQVLEHPDRKWYNGMSDEEMHNLYPLLASQQMHEGFREYTGRRACCFTPAGWAGLQRYTGTWTGDTGGGAATLVACLNLALSGHYLVTCDMEVTTKEGIHYGFLMPWAQVNSWNYWRHPWLLGDELYGVFKDYACLRYRLLPYIYTCASQAHRMGMPVMRPMVLAFPEEIESHKHIFQYMFGPCLLIGTFEKAIYLPAGEWFDYWTGEKHTGPSLLNYVPPENRGGGLFVKAGAIIPLGPDIQYVGQKAPNVLTLEVFPGADGDFTLYEDDGISYNYENGAFAETPFHVREDGNSIRIEIGPRSGNYAGMPEPPEYLLRVHLHQEPAEVICITEGSPRLRLEQHSAKELKDDVTAIQSALSEGSWVYDPTRRLLWVRPGRKDGRPFTVEIRMASC